MEIGSCPALIYKISTLLDGGVRLTLDIDSSNTDVITKLMERKLQNKPLIQLGMIGLDHGGNGTTDKVQWRFS